MMPTLLLALVTLVLMAWGTLDAHLARWEERRRRDDAETFGRIR